MTSSRRSLVVLLAAVAALGVVPPAPRAASYVSCAPVRDPYPGTRYAGVDLTRVRGLHMACTATRRVARRAHRKALRVTPAASGFRRFTWRGWRVTGDLRPARDRYVAAGATVASAGASSRRDPHGGAGTVENGGRWLTLGRPTWQEGVRR